MFCHKCGSKSIEGSAFCQKCGTKLIVDDASQQAPVAPTPKPVVSAPVPQSPVSFPPQAPTTADPKKKSKKLLVGLAGIAVIAIIVLIVSNLGSKDYIKDVKGWKPYADYGISATVGTVLDKYLAPVEWTQVEHGNGVTYYVNANGKLDGNTAQMRFFVNKSNKTIRWGVQSFKLGDETYEKEDAEAWFESFFDAYEAGATAMSEYYGGSNNGTAHQTSGLVGQWESVDENVISFFGGMDMELSPDGTAIMYGNLIDTIGSWVDSGNGQFSVTDENNDTYMFRYEISGDRLTLTDSDGSSNTYRRVGGAGGSVSQSQTESDMYFVERNDSVSSDELQPAIALHPDGTFTFRVNLLYDMAQASGTYNQFGNQYTLYIMESTFDNYDTFAMEIEGDSLIYRGDDWIGATAPGAVFYKTDGATVGTANSNQGGSPGSTSTDEVLYNGKPIMNWIGASLPSLRDVFGDPDVEGVVWEGGTYGYQYDDGTTFNKNYNGEYIDAIWGNPATLTFNGSPLDINRDGLVGLFGDPVDESWSEDYGYETFRVRFIYQGEYEISFSLDRPSTGAYEFWINEYTP